MTRVTAVAALLSVVVSTPVFAQCSEADRTALETLDKGWSVATRNGDRAFLTNVLADNFMAVNPTGTTDKATTIANAERNAAQLRANPNPQPAGTTDRYVISCTPLTATITHRNVGPVAAGSTTPPAYSRSVHFLEKRGNTWQAVSTTGHAINDQQQLVYMEMDWNDAIKAHDADWVAANYAPFASDVSSRTGAIQNRTQAMEAAKTDKTVFDVLELSELNSRVEGDVGVVTGINRLKGKDAQGKPFDRSVRFTDTFIKRDGRWQVWATQGTTVQK
jgi:ketosteroid isomerase-like protein